MPGLSDLPTDILVLVYKQLDDIDDALRLRRACQNLHQVFEPENRLVILKGILSHLDYSPHQDNNSGWMGYKRNTVTALDFLVNDLTCSPHSVPGVGCRWHTIKLLMQFLVHEVFPEMTLVGIGTSETIRICKPKAHPAGSTEIDPATLSYRYEGLEFLADSLTHGTDQNKGDALIWAAVNGLEAVIQLMLDIGADIHYEVVGEVIATIGGKTLVQQWLDEIPGTPLVQAVYQGHVGAVRRLLDAGADIQDRSGKDMTVLHWAVMKGFVDMTKELLERGADIEAGARGGVTPLELASMVGRVKSVEVLLDHGADIRGAEQGPVWYAVMGDDSSALPLLLERGADANYRPAQLRSPLFWAIQNKNLDAVTMLVGYGADIEERNEHGRTPLARACKVGSVEIAEWLLAKGANLHVKDNDGRTVLHLAAEKGSRDVCKWLLKQGLNTDAHDNAGNTPDCSNQSRREGYSNASDGL